MEGEPKNENLILEELTVLRDKLWESDAGYDECVSFAKKLLEKYPDARKYKLLHLLIGSTPSDDVTKFDFPGEDSIETFIRSL